MKSIGAALVLSTVAASLSAQTVTWEIPMPAVDSVRYSLTVRPDGAIWFFAKQDTSGVLVRTDRSGLRQWIDGTVAAFASPSAASGEQVIMVAGPSLRDGDIGSLGWERFTRPTGEQFRLFATHMEGLSLARMRNAPASMQAAQYLAMMKAFQRALVISDSLANAKPSQ